MEGIPQEDLIAHEQAINSGGNPAKRFKAGGTSEYSPLTPEQIQSQIAAHKAGGLQPAVSPGYYPPAAPVAVPPVPNAYPAQYSQYYQQQPPQYPPRPPPMGYRPPYGPPPGYGGPPPPQQWSPVGGYPPPAGVSQGYPLTPNAAGMPASPNSPARPPTTTMYGATPPGLTSVANSGPAPSAYPGVPYGSPAHDQAYDPNAAPGQAAGNYETTAALAQPSVPSVPQTIAPGGKQKPTKTQLIYNDSEISPVSQKISCIILNECPH
jgi:hypothetical protein